MNSKNNKTAIVIGSGFGGLAIAIRLQARGINTLILEKNEMVGGHAYQFKSKGYTFDMGPSIITLPHLIQELFTLNNEKMHKYLDLTKIDPFYRVYFHDGSHIDVGSDMHQMHSQLAKFNQNDADNYYRFMEYSKNLYDIVIEDGLGEQPFDSMADFIKIIPKALKAKAIPSSYNTVSKYFEDFRSRFLFSFHPLFIGGSPFSTPSLFLCLPYLEKAGGVWFTKGGMYSVVEALRDLFIRMGGRINTNTEVVEIIVENGTAKGVKALVNSKDPLVLKSDIIVSNSHFANTYKDLIKPQHRKKWTDNKIVNKDYSMSSFLLYLGVKKKFPQLLHHTLMLSPRYKELIYEIFANELLPRDFSLYLHAPSVSDPSMAPEGCESLYLLAPVPNLSANIDWEKVQENYTLKILNSLERDFGLEGLKDNLEVFRMYTPKDFERERNNYLGACWSLQPKMTQIANFRPHNRSEDINNLYLVGASTHPGGGVPGVILSAKTTEKVILEDMNK